MAPLTPLQEKLLHHPLWQGIEDGSLDKERLKLFALQDWWLVREAYRLDALSIAAANGLETQELLLDKLASKKGGYKLLWRFGEALGLNRADFDRVEPLAGCMALTNFFYWMLAYGSAPEKIAALSASEDIFIQICQRVGPALVKNYGLTPAQVEFFTFHDEIEKVAAPVDQSLFETYTSEEDRLKIARATRLSNEFELMFYDTIISHPL